MAVTCPDCGIEVAPGTKFCPECGARQPERPAPSREVRKVVTVLFADVTGSTALGESLDPEALRALMTRYFARMRQVIEAHGGTVEKFIGDAVMAVFGIPAVHEDDALRAVRAAWEIRDALAALNAELEAERGLSIRFRTGVNTGEVVAGDPDTGTTLVTGDTVNTAARLEQAAPPGEILLGRLTYSLVRDAVDAVPVEPVEAKGKAEPLEAYRLSGVTLGAAGRTRHLDAPLVGRERELALLGETWRRVVDTRTPHLVTLVAPAGVGKSRLVREFIAGVRSDGGRALVGRCLSYGEGITYWPVRELVHQAAGITEQDDQAAARSKVDDLLVGSPDCARVGTRLASAFGLAAGGVAQDELFWSVRRLLEHLAAEQPTLVVLEDLHWADEPLLDLVDYLVDLAQGVPLLLLGTTRPELAEHRPGFTAARDAATVFRLEPLAGDAAGALLDAQPGGAAIPDALRARILDAAEGTPLYVEEFVGLLRDDGHLALNGETWTARSTAELVAVPLTIQALLAARLEGLPEPERVVARRASVIGRSFEVAALADMDPTAASDLSRRLLALVRKELLRPDRAELTVGDAFRFRHVLIRDAAYDALPKAERAVLHERFAGWLEGAAGDRLAEVREIVAFHLGEAHRYRTEVGDPGSDLADLARRAGLAYLEAARTAYGREDVAATFTAVSHAAELLPTSRAQGDALALRFRVAPHVGEFPARAASLERLAALAEELGDEPLAQQATVGRLHFALDNDPELDWPAARATFDRLAPEFARRDEFEWQSDALRLSGICASGAGDEGRHLALARAAVEAARRRGWPVLVALCTSEVVVTLAVGPTHVDDAISEIIDIVADDPARTTRAYSLQVLSLLEAMRDDPDASDRLTAESDALLVSLGRAVDPSSSAWTDLSLQRWSQAAAKFAAADEQTSGIGDIRFEALQHTALGHARLELGDANGALEASIVAERRSSPHDFETTIRWRIVRGRALVETGDADRGIAFGEETVTLAMGFQLPELQGESLLAMAQMYGAVGRATDAEETARRALAVFVAKGHRSGVRRTEAFMAAGGPS
jgi:class 3 adenylate cyclase